MESQEGGSSKENDDNDISESDSKKPSTPDYTATGARPKIFPVTSVSVANRQATSKKPSHDHRTPTLARPNSEYSGVEEEPGFAFSTKGSGQNAFGSNINWPGGSFDVNFGYNERESEEASTVEITFENKDQEEDFREEDDSERWAASSSLGFGASTVAKKEENDGFEELAQEFPAAARAVEEDRIRVKCPYCKRDYNASFFDTHLGQCIDNPGVADEKREVKYAVEASLIADWRSAPNPPQATWGRSVPVNESAGEHAWHDPIPYRPAIQWEPATSDQSFPSTSAEVDAAAGGGDDDAAAAASSYTGFSFGFGNAYEYDEPMIPCEFCSVLLPSSVILEHQSHCEVGL